MAFVLIDPHAEKPAILGIMSIFADPEGARAEYAGAVRSDLKGQGLGRLLLEEIVECCQRRAIRVAQYTFNPLVYSRRSRPCFAPRSAV